MKLRSSRVFLYGNTIIMRFVVLPLLLLLPCPVMAALPIDLEVVDQGAPPGSMQRWSRVLGECDLARVRIRGANRSDELGVRTIDAGRSKRYVVTAMLDSRNRLILPGAKFTDGQQAALQRFFRELPLDIEHNRQERGRFGLTAEQFKQVFEHFSRPVEIAEGEIEPTKVLKLLAQQARIPVDIDSRIEQRLSGKPPVVFASHGLTLGTTLAMFLREHGAAMVPEQPRGGELQLRVFALPEDQRDLSHWPVGWQSESPPRALAPNLYRSTVIEINGFHLDETLQALSPPAGLPLVYDQYVLDRKEIKPTKVQVKVERKNMTIRRGIDLVLRQARLTGEARVDEEGTPFYWITQFGNGSPRASK